MPESITFDDLGTKYRYFEYRDLPARKLSADDRPEVYRPGKGWGPVKDTFDFLHNYVVADEERVKAMIARLERVGQH